MIPKDNILDLFLEAPSLEKEAMQVMSEVPYSLTESQFEEYILNEAAGFTALKFAEVYMPNVEVGLIKAQPKRQNKGFV